MSQSEDFSPKRAWDITRPLILTSSYPIQRLRALCQRGNYSYLFTWDCFANGILMGCEIYYFSGKRRQTLSREFQFVNTIDVDEAKRIIARKLLYNIGLGIEYIKKSNGEIESPEVADISETSIFKEDLVTSLQTVGMKLVKEILSQKGMTNFQIQSSELLESILNAFKDIKTESKS